MASLNEGRQPSSLEVQWPLLYANKDLIGQGTLIKLSRGVCQVAGTMPVATGMLLRVWISPATREEALYVTEARVLLACEHEFGPPRASSLLSDLLFLRLPRKLRR
jgi:hypothetical protein